VRPMESPFDALRLLVAFHTDFALRDRDLIRIQDHDFANLAVEACSNREPPGNAPTSRSGSACCEQIDPTLF